MEGYKTSSEEYNALLTLEKKQIKEFQVGDKVQFIEDKELLTQRYLSTPTKEMIDHFRMWNQNVQYLIVEEIKEDDHGVPILILKDEHDNNRGA